MTDTLDESHEVTEGSVSIRTVAAPLEHNFDTQALAKEPAQAIAAGVADGIRGITEMSRDRKHRLFNRTGFLADSIEAVADDDGGYSILAPDGYLQDDELMQRLIDLVPAIEDPTTIDGLQTAVEDSCDILVKGGA